MWVRYARVGRTFLSDAFDLHDFKNWGTSRLPISLSVFRFQKNIFAFPGNHPERCKITGSSFSNLSRAG